MDSQVYWIPVVGILSGAAIVLMAMWVHVKQRETAVRERLAMIERGIVPPPANHAASPAARTTQRRAERYRSAGVLWMGTGLALGFLIAVAGGERGVGVGVGGSFLVLGAALFVNARLLARDADRMPLEPATDTRSPQEPPGRAPAAASFFEEAGDIEEARRVPGPPAD